MGLLSMPPAREGADPTLQATGSCWRFNLDRCIPGTPLVHCWDASMMRCTVCGKPQGPRKEIELSSMVVCVQHT